MPTIFSPRASTKSTLAKATDGTASSLSPDPISVTFNKDKVICGVSSSALESRGTVIATISPAAEASKVTFDTSNHDRALVTEESRTTNDDSGTVSVTLKLEGVSATPVEYPDGDTSLQALANEDNVVNSIPVVVVIPKSIGTRSPIPFDEIVDGSNILADAETLPACWDPLTPYQCVLWTFYGAIITVTVLDQFGNTLDSVYNGARVQERDPGDDWRPTNACVMDGKYFDPIGRAYYKTPGPSVVDNSSNAATNWPTAPCVPPDDTIETRTPDVSIDEHVLTGIPERFISTKAVANSPSQARLQIFW